jgi:hypothetical protein
MARHKFAVGQEVSFLPSVSDFNVPRGTYRIVRQLPFEVDSFTYRVKNLNDGHERVMRESQLVSGDGPWMPAPAKTPAKART